MTSSGVQPTFQILDAMALHPKLAKSIIDTGYHTVENVQWVLFNPPIRSQNPECMSVLFHP